MRWLVRDQVPFNSYDYLQQTLITANGFREYDLRWLLGKEINPNGFYVLGRAYGSFAQMRYGETKVVVGHDFRQYSQECCRSLILGLLSSGAHVLDIGLATTPMVYFAQHCFGVKAAAMVTASHNENGWTGLKLAKGLSATFEPDDISGFRQIVMGDEFKSGNGHYEAVDGVYERYSDDILQQGALNGPLKVVVAAGNGTAGCFAPRLLSRLGCDVIPLDCDGDWTFPNHNPNPEDVAFLRSISSKTVETGAALGIGIDGDGDRIGVVDGQGRVIFSDKLGLLMARWLCQSVGGRPIVIDVKSTGLFNDDAMLRAAKANVIIWKTGHSYIKAKVAESDAIAGFEKSGHWFFNHPFGRGYDDAMLSSALLLRFLSQSKQRLAELVDSLPATWQSPTMGAYCPDDLKYGVVDEVAKQYEEDYRYGRTIMGRIIKELITVNGIRFVLDDDSWGLVRASSNKPSLVVVGEARSSANELVAIIEDIQRRLKMTGKVGEYDQQLSALDLATTAGVVHEPPPRDKRPDTSKLPEAK
jgi:phosphomannomutase / phosphoglucomutase